MVTLATSCGPAWNVRRYLRLGVSLSPRRSRWYDLRGECALTGDHDELSVAAAADFEDLPVCFLQSAQNIGHESGAVQLWRPPADGDPFADVGGCDQDLEPVAHAFTSAFQACSQNSAVNAAASLRGA